jgi:hypothetical protein
MPALAARGGGGPAGGTASSSIAIASIDGAPAGAATVTPKLGDRMTFATAAEPLAGWESPMVVVVSCYRPRGTRAPARTEGQRRSAEAEA